MWWDPHFGQSFVVAGDSKLILAPAGPKNEDSHDTILLLSAVNGMEGNREAAFTTRSLAILATSPLAERNLIIRF